MSNLLFSIWGRRLAVWGSLAMGLAQVGCAHPLVVEPQVVVSSRAVYPPVYGQVYGRGHAHVPAPTVILPPPRPVYLPPPPPRVVYQPAPPRVLYHPAPPRVVYQPAPPQVLYRPPVHSSPAYRPAPQWRSGHHADQGGQGGHGDAKHGRDRRDGERGHGRGDEREPWRR